jgi:hypothetical protein
MRRPPNAERRPPWQESGALDITRGDGDEISVHRDPASLALAVAELLELSGERDAWQARLGDEYRLGWKLGYEAGRREGYEAGARQLEAEWPAIVRPLAGPSLQELELRRWGPGGRARFGDPRPGDFKGRHEGAA